MVREHVLLPAASRIAQADAELAPKLDRALFDRVLAEVPDEWLGDAPAAVRVRYVDYLAERLDRRAAFVEEARRAHG